MMTILDDPKAALTCFPSIPSTLTSHYRCVSVHFQIGVFSPSTRSHYLNITPNNIVRIYVKSSSDDTVATEELSKFTEDDFAVPDTVSPPNPQQHGLMSPAALSISSATPDVLYSLPCTPNSSSVVQSFTPRASGQNSVSRDYMSQTPGKQYTPVCNRTVPQARTCNLTMPPSPACNRAMPQSPACNRTMPQTPSSNRTMPQSPPCIRTVPQSPACNRTVTQPPVYNRTVTQPPVYNRTVPQPPACNRAMPQSSAGNRTVQQSPACNRAMPQSTVCNRTVPQSRNCNLTVQQSPACNRAVPQSPVCNRTKTQTPSSNRTMPQPPACTKASQQKVDLGKVSRFNFKKLQTSSPHHPSDDDNTVGNLHCSSSVTDHLGNGE